MEDSDDGVADGCAMRGVPVKLERDRWPSDRVSEPGAKDGLSCGNSKEKNVPLFRFVDHTPGASGQ